MAENKFIHIELRTPLKAIIVGYAFGCDSININLFLLSVDINYKAKMGVSFYFHKDF